MIYIHIPFCDSKCGYCSFNSFTDKSSVELYFDKLFLQLENQLGLIENIDSIYIGGGTPSSVEFKHYEKLFKLLPKVKEFTVEANPNSASKEWLKEMKNHGVNRISFGVQSFNDEKLKFLTRIHDSEEAVRAVERTYNSGFDNISVDLIYNTALDTKKLLENEIKAVEKLPVTHVSAYSLTIEKNSKFENRFDKANEDEELSRFFINKIDKKFKQYEISSFGRESIHNRGYWEYKEYLGIGAGAVGRIGNKRYYPNKNLEKYIENPLQYDVETLEENEIKNEKIFLGLRSCVGVDKTLFNKQEIAKIQTLLNDGYLYEKDEKIYNNNYLIADEIALWVDSD